MEEKILTMHPQGKKGVNISKKKYDQVKKALTDTLNELGACTFKELTQAVQEMLKHNFEGSITWYLVTVKLDLEARNIIQRIPKTSPHKVRLNTQV